MINKEELKNLAELSKLELSEEELTKYSKEMADIIALMDTIADSGFSYDPKGEQNAVSFSSLRKDEAKDFDSKEKIVECGPDTFENMFVVPKTIE